MTHNPEAPPRGALGARLGHGAGDSKGQQGCPAGSCALALTSGEGWEQRHSPGHAVYGMQGVGQGFKSPQLHRNYWSVAEVS
jgi:hypothetical protein